MGNMAEHPNFKAPSKGLSVFVNSLKQLWEVGGAEVQPGGVDTNTLERVRITASFYFFGPVSRWGATIVHRFPRFLWSSGSQKGVTSSLRGHLTMSGDIFDSHNQGRRSYWHWVGAVQGLLLIRPTIYKTLFLRQERSDPQGEQWWGWATQHRIIGRQILSVPRPFPYSVKTEVSQTPALSAHREQKITVQGCTQHGLETPSQPRAPITHCKLCPLPARPLRHRMGGGKPETFKLGSASCQHCGLGCFLNPALLHASFLLLCYGH